MESDTAASVSDGAVNEPPQHCSVCGRSADEDTTAVITWSLEVDEDRWRWTCPNCARDHVQDIEARLAEDWW